MAIKSGAQSNVHLCINKNNKICALKEYSNDQIGNESTNRYYTECKFLKRFENIEVKHVIKLAGAPFEIEEVRKSFIPLEYCNGGDLSSYLESQTFKDRLRDDYELILEIAI